jgi:phytanoyl-CoA dioxygenase PhyH
MLSENFLELDAGKIAETIASDGVVSIESALTPDAIAAIQHDVESHRTGFNLNGVTGVYYHKQFYLCHMLAVSRTFTQLVTHPKVMEITQAVIGAEYRLKALRYYETFGRHHMQWHTDNKTDRGFAQIPGIIFIAYISDVEEGEFQYVLGSHKWSGEKAYNDYGDTFVDETLSEKVRSFTGRAGTVVIYDTYGIHRAKPVPRPDFVRKSLFWQIDREIDKGEPLLINPEFLPQMDSKLQRYLGFGLPSGYEIFPQSNINTIPTSAAKMPDALHMLNLALRNRAKRVLGRK